MRATMRKIWMNLDSERRNCGETLTRLGILSQERPEWIVLQRNLKNRIGEKIV